MAPGQMVRVSDWPGTNGQRFKVVRIDERFVHAIDRGGKLRSFPKENCHVDRKETRSEASR